MASSGQLTSSALQALLQDGKLTGLWALDASTSEVQLKSRSLWGLVPVKGVFRQVTGSGTVSAAGDVTGTITVASRSVDTKNQTRDKHLRSADFFDVANHPDITFTVDGIRPDKGAVKVAGSLTVRGRTRPVSFDAQASSADGEVRLDGQVEVNRADFGLTWNRMGMLSIHDTITVHAVFTRQYLPAPPTAPRPPRTAEGMG
jgi:polyisoprenoid-binding protein YceI